MTTIVLLDGIQVPENPDDSQIIPILNEASHSVGELRLDVSGTYSMVYISWRIEPEYRGQGHATKGAAQLLPHLFRHYHRVVAVIAADNEPSKEVARRLGMRYEGTAVKSRWDIMKREWRDIEFWALLQEDLARHQSWIGKSH